MGLTEIDREQTLYVANHPTQFYEHNPILGIHPTPAVVNLYFAFALLHPVVSCILGQPYRMLWQGSTIVIEGVTTFRNHSVGIKP